MKIIDFDTIILIQSSSLYKEFNNVINAMTHRLSNIIITHNDSFRTYKETVFAKSSRETSFYTFEAKLYREKESNEYVISSQYTKNNDEYISCEVKEKVIEIMIHMKDIFMILLVMKIIVKKYLEKIFLLKR